MPWIRILSGSQAGSIVNVTETEAQANVDTGFAEYVTEEAKPEESKPQEAPKESASRPSRSSRRKADEEDEE